MIGAIDLDGGGYSPHGPSEQVHYRLSWAELTPEQRRIAAARVWAAGIRVRGGTRAAAYLLTLGADRDHYSKSLRYHPSYWVPSLGAHMPALMARVVSPLHREVLEAVQPVLLDPYGQGPLLADAGHMLGDSPRGVVCLGNIDAEHVIVSRKLSIAISARAMLGLPAIATLTHFRMTVLELPPEVKRVTIALPRAGRADSAFDLRDRLERDGIQVHWELPPEGFRTWPAAARARL